MLCLNRDVAPNARQKLFLCFDKASPTLYFYISRVLLFHFVPARKVHNLRVAFGEN